MSELPTGATAGGFAGLIPKATLSAEMSRIASSLREVDAALDGTKRNMTNTVREFDGQVEALKANLAHANASVQAVQGGASQVAQTLDEVVKFVTREIGR